MGKGDYSDMSRELGSEESGKRVKRIAKEKMEAEGDGNRFEPGNEQHDRFGPNPNGKEDPLDWLRFENFKDLPDEQSEQVIEGLLRIGEKLGVSAGTKRFKTWLLLYIAYCVANGLPFLGFKTLKNKVVFFDLELSRNGLKRRLQRIQEAMGGKGDFGNLTICSLRGKAQRFCQNLDGVKAKIVAGQFKVVIIDPVYKFLLGKEENSNGLVAEVLENLTVFCMEADVAMIYVHHHSKGNQAGKDSLDRSSGAGAWSRDPDAVLDLAEHDESTQDDRIFTAEITVRDFPPIEKFVVRWNFPLLERDTGGLDPSKLKQQAKAGRPREDNTNIVMAVFRAFETEGGATAKQVHVATRIPLRSVQRTIKELMPARLVKAVLKNGFQLSVSEAAEMQKFESQQNGEDDPAV